MTKLRLTFCLIISLILELSILCLSVAISTLDHYKLKNMTGKIMNESFSNLLNHPINAISGMISKRDPVLIVGTIVILAYMAYVVYKSSNKDTYEIESKYAVHGSSRFANNNEIFVKDETIGIPVNQMFRDLESSMGIGSETNELNELKESDELNETKESIEIKERK